MTRTTETINRQAPSRNARIGPWRAFISQWTSTTFVVISLAGLTGCATRTGLDDAVNLGCDLALLAQSGPWPAPFPLSPCKANALGIKLIEGALTRPANESER